MATTENIFLEKAMIIERKNERFAAILTTIIMVVILLLAFLMLLELYRDIQIGEGDKYEVVGSIDFGDYSNGSKRVNTYAPPVENPTPVENPQPTPQQPSPTPTETAPAPSEAAPAETNPTPSDVVTTTRPTETTTPPATEQPQENPSTPQNTQTESSNTNTDNSSDAQAEQEQEEGLDFSMGGGSNEGDANEGTGNQGTPNTQILDPDGLYSFAQSGPGALKGRKPLSLPKPEYSSQEEGKITFKIIIGPDGSVLFASPDGPVAPGMSSLVKAGRSALMRWKFSRGTRQEVKVTITFKLR